MKTAIQMYTLRQAEESLAELLAAIASAGYQGIETVGTQGVTANELKELLHTHGLQVCSSHTALSALREDLDDVIRFAHSVGNDTLVMPYLSADLYDDQATTWQQLGQELATIGERCQTEGLSLMYHNHDFELITIEGKTALEHLLDSVPAEHLGIELDLAWIVRGGADPRYFLSKYAGRCSRVHIKDIAPEGENQDQGGWADVGEGTVDIAGLLPKVQEAGATWCIVEHDLPRDPLATMRNSGTNLSTMLNAL